MLKEFVRENNARVIVRGLRAVSDFEYESRWPHEPLSAAGCRNHVLTPSDQYQLFLAP